MNEETAVATIPQTTPIPVDVQLTATEPDEIAAAQQSLILWTQQKIESLKIEHKELSDARDHAMSQKWASGPLKRHASIAAKRIEFYEKMKAALEAGYVIIPNFPVTVFAIRTKKESPLRVFKSSGTSWNNTHQQISEALNQGEGKYQNPFPVVTKECVKSQTQTTAAEYMDYAEEWKDLEFPVQMSKVKIMEATTNAMALKLFDDFGIMPERKKEDPIIVARLLDPRSTKWNRRFVTFMVAWHLNTRDL